MKHLRDTKPYDEQYNSTNVTGNPIALPGFIRVSAMGRVHYVSMWMYSEVYTRRHNVLRSIALTRCYPFKSLHTQTQRHNALRTIALTSINPRKALIVPVSNLVHAWDIYKIT